MNSTANQESTGLGNYFVANYPPFSFWNKDSLVDAEWALNQSPTAGNPLGLYLHIPFCRKRCKFCYFRVYTDKNANDVESYVNAIIREIELFSRTEAVGGRKPEFVYFGGGTPSYLSSSQLRNLMESVNRLMPWSDAREVAFECEPGTLQFHKLQTLKDLGVTRLSLGVENFKPEILRYNGRAHSEQEIYRAYGWARELGFNQINIDLIAGMVGEDTENWRDTVRKTLTLAPDSVTIYQMELPYNTVFSKELNESTSSVGGGLPMLDSEGDFAATIADWPTKREWVRYAYDEFRAAGYEISSAYTLVKSRDKNQFVYRDALWHGADMFGTGVASFGFVNGVHYQNKDRWEDYLETLTEGKLPLSRALRITDHQRLVREMILQMKLGKLDREYFLHKYGSDILADYRSEFIELVSKGYLNVKPTGIELTMDGLLRVDRLLPAFFEREHITDRYV